MLKVYAALFRHVLLYASRALQFTYWEKIGRWTLRSGSVVKLMECEPADALQSCGFSAYPLELVYCQVSAADFSSASSAFAPGDR
jgi:hypothetical protein